MHGLFKEELKWSFLDYSSNNHGNIKNSLQPNNYSCRQIWYLLYQCRRRKTYNESLLLSSYLQTKSVSLAKKRKLDHNFYLDLRFISTDSIEFSWESVTLWHQKRIRSFSRRRKQKKKVDWVTSLDLCPFTFLRYLSLEVIIGIKKKTTAKMICAFSLD